MLGKSSAKTLHLGLVFRGLGGEPQFRNEGLGAVLGVWVAEGGVLSTCLSGYMYLLNTLAYGEGA